MTMIGIRYLSWIKLKRCMVVGAKPIATKSSSLLGVLED